jgi:hypothetical protein
MSDRMGLAEARLAVSPHNTQPWRFSRRGNTSLIGWEADRELPSGDPYRRYLLTGLGAAAESMALGGALVNRLCRISVTIDRESREAAALEFAPGSPAERDRILAETIIARHTNRRPYAKTPPPPSALDAMSRAAADRGCELRFLTDENTRRLVGRLLGRATLLNFRDRDVFREFYRWLRLDKRHPRYAVDGLTLETLEFGHFGSIGAPLALRPPVMRGLNALRIDRALAETQASLARRSGAIGLIATDGGGLEDYFAGGQGLTRAWLTAVEHGLSVHPVTAMLDHTDTAAELRRAFGVGEATSMIASFRIGFAEPTPHRAPRRALINLTSGDGA